MWALSGGTVPLALSVLQVLALDIGTDLLPALALGAEPANPRTMRGPARTGALLDRRLLRRVFCVLGPVEAVVEMAAFVAVLMLGGWALGTAPTATLLTAASGAAFAAVVLGQLANAFACRSETRWAGRLPWRNNRILLGAVVIETVMLLVFLGFPPLAALLGGTLPPLAGWALAALAIPAVIGADALHKGCAPGAEHKGLWARTGQDDRPCSSARSRSDSGENGSRHRTGPSSDRRFQKRPTLVDGRSLR